MRIKEVDLNSNRKTYYAIKAKEKEIYFRHMLSTGETVWGGKPYCSARTTPERAKAYAERLHLDKIYEWEVVPVHIDELALYGIDEDDELHSPRE